MADKTERWGGSDWGKKSYLLLPLDDTPEVRFVMGDCGVAIFSISLLYFHKCFFTSNDSVPFKAVHM